jgi:putative membrane protein
MGGFIGLLFNVAILVGIVLLVVWAVQKFSDSTRSSAPTTSPNQTLSAREILDIRYARGELTREEYQTRLSDMTS